ncbi:hypothetical protein D8B26_004451 [Coccidioides posadasii str. Silveira]|uniref:uncharacterized protein n=1 Tax=Coccidioides posadasii (strain RMSCC 757 / Silveira) TaxID=443226 RepID=UPI001BED7E35|nr:hypothetical protein D8B26_004451 [Coccidioides posadasii str. Silveira]
MLLRIMTTEYGGKMSFRSATLWASKKKIKNKKKESKKKGEEKVTKKKKISKNSLLYSGLRTFFFFIHTALLACIRSTEYNLGMYVSISFFLFVARIPRVPHIMRGHTHTHTHHKVP